MVPHHLVIIHDLNSYKFFCDKNFQNLLSQQLQIHNAALLTMVSKLYITSLRPIYLITGNLYLLTMVLRFMLALIK